MTDASEAEPMVFVTGPPEHKDIVDLATGLRFVEGKSTERIPLSKARELFGNRQGYYIEGTRTIRPRKEV
jgi:hypothetical protein